MQTSHDAELSLNQPSPYAAELIDKLAQWIQPERYKKDWRLPHDIDEGARCYVLIEGSVSVHRRSDELVLTTIQSPTVIGLGTNLPEVNSVFLKTLTECTIGVLPREQVMAIVEEHNLWKPLANHLMVILNKLYVTNRQLIGTSAYETIRIQLLLLMNEPDDYREAKFVAQYIREKTLLSRSGIMKILSQLRQGGYIEIENGILKKVNKLPAKY